MAQSICLDTSIIIQYLRKRNKSETVLYNLGGVYPNLFLPAISHYEIIRGLTEVHYEEWQVLLDNFVILPFDLQASGAAATIYKSLRSKNQQIETADLLIASIAISNNLPLATLNEKHFLRISDLTIVS